MIARRNFLTAAALGLTVPLGFGFSFSKSKSGWLELRAKAIARPVAEESEVLSPLYLYNGVTPGPEIRVRQGEQLRVRFFNDLNVPTTIHWHGIRIDNAMDGVPSLTQPAVQPGESFDYEFIVPDAGTYWYHAHVDSFQQVARGLYGTLIVEEREPVINPNHEVLMVLDDWWIEKDGSFADGFQDYLKGKQGGRVGNEITLNGKYLGGIENVIANAPYRLRIVNAANARTFHLDVSELRANLIALDGQPINPRLVKDIFLAPAQRADLAIQLEAGETVSIRDGDGTLQGQGPSDASTFVTTFQGIPNNHSDSTATPRFAEAKLPAPDVDQAVRVPLIIEGGSLAALKPAMLHDTRADIQTLIKAQQVWTFNETSDLPIEPLFNVPVGTSVVIEMKNRTGWQHPMHIHGHHFRVIEGNTSRPSDAWHDTVLIDRTSNMNVAFVADNPGKWLLHCHLLQHAASGMRTWFQVTKS